jgi:flavin reductase (DIM6/NTAB) family NADH-FMN oxidoreductase RutF/DNA-binding GntR family transcriptional regulator
MSETPESAVEHVDREIFRDVIGRFASGVTVITTRTGDVDFGTTASAVSSLSMEPPMLLICLNKTSETRQAIAESGWFAVNILGEHQTDIAYAFAKKSPDKFGDAEVLRGQQGIPLIPGALAQLECRVDETAVGGTHTVFMGTVLEASAGDGEPLTYYRGRFGRFEDTLQDVAYRRLRELVVHRDLPREEPLDVEALATTHDLQQAHVFYALTKLVTDGLMARRPDGQFVVRPLDVRTAQEAIDARCAIEVAVVEAKAGQVADADATALRAYSDAAQQAATADPPNIDALVEAGHAFHRHFIGLLDNEALLTFHDRLDVQAIWRRAAPVIDKRGRTSAAYLPQLVDTFLAGDRDGAKRVLYEHAAEVKDSAREAIESLGGDM